MEPMIPGSGPHDFRPLAGPMPGFLGQLIARLQSSEWMLVQLMVAAGVWAGAAPLPPVASREVRGDLEWGTVLFLLNHTPRIADETIRLLADAFEALLALAGVSLPPSLVPPAQYDGLDAHKLVAPTDGSLLGTAPYELYDQKWMGAFFNLVRSVVEGRIAHGGHLPIPPAGRPTHVAPARDGRVTLALVSDWGTGQPAARAVIAALAAADPDLAVHLGDTYYSGTPAAGPFQPPGEEQSNLLDPWPASLAGRSFALNANHEMYSGAQGYFAALASPGGVFAAQGECSIFAIRIGEWTVLGLDSSFHADPVELYLYGSLDSDADKRQTEWIRSLALDPARTIVLTHHNALDVGCDPTAQADYAAFWTQVRSALGGDPFAWYWGHVHNGIAYASPLTVGDAAAPVLATTTRCRCLGHGALPYGDATDLDGNATVVWRTSTKSGVGAELLNGFVMLTFDLATGGMSEAYGDRNGIKGFQPFAGSRGRAPDLLTRSAPEAAAPPAPVPSAAAGPAAPARFPPP